MYACKAPEVHPAAHWNFRNRLLGQPVVAWDAAVLASTAKGKAFKELVARVESELDLKLHYHTFDQLAVKFGGEGVAEQAKKQFEFYKVRFARPGLCVA